MSKGNPKLQIRLDVGLAERAKEAFPKVDGRSGGLALAVRQLLYVVLDEPIPRQYGEVRRTSVIDDLEDMARSIECGQTSVDWIEEGLEDVRRVSTTVDDPVDVLRLRAVAGRLVLAQATG